MNCAACGHTNPERAKFCLECGAAFAARCASCGLELPPAAKFCLECGTRVGAARAGPASGARSEPQASEGQGARKIVTIIFGDLVGSTALHERLDAESVRQFMEGYYAAMRGAVEAHGGRVTQVMGDGVKAVFGAPRVAEDDAIRAVRAAVAMQEAFRALAEQQRGRVGKTGLRVAVNTGEVIADGESEIIGDPVNVAARLQEQGKDGDVVVGGATQRIVAALVTLELLGRFSLKGRAEQVEAYRVVSLEPPAATKAPFVGRDEELARLSAVYETAVAKPSAQLAVLLGSPGLGKSRLIDEFVRRLGEGATVLAAHCDASGGATFAPLVAALREHLGIDDGAKPETLRAGLEAALPAGDADRARIAGGVAELLGGSPASPEETFFVVRRLLAALAQSKPVVLVIDDLHWAESLLLDLVEHLVQWGSGVPLFVLVGARPELRELRSSLVMPGGFVADVLTLVGLDAGAAMRLAAGVIGAADLPAALAAKLLATSEGNPLFVGELMKMLVQEGVLHRDGERWVASAALADLEMPPTIHALLAARIERLRPEERAVLERAAVVGRHFSKSSVAALLSQTSDLDARLEALRRSELIERDTGWYLGEPVLRFHHVLIRDAAYRRVLKGTRAELHARLAAWIETKVGEAAEHDETIGWHLEQAHQHLRELGPVDAGGISLGERAARRLAAAGRRALARDDLALAANILGRALACLPAEAEERADLALDWCEALLSAGEVGPAAAALDEFARAGADSERLRAWHTCFAGQLTTLTSPQGLHATAESVAAAATVLAALGDAAGEAKAHFVHAQALARLGKVGACEAALDLALAAARRAGDRRRANAVLAGAPRAALWGPSPVTRASGRCLDVVRVLRITQGAPAVEAVALSCQGVLEALRGRTDAAKRMIASSRKLVEELGIAHRLFEADVFAGRVALLEGDASAAEQSLRGAYEGLRDLGLGIDAAQAAALLARALLAKGRAAEAEALSHESEALAGDDLQAAIAWRGVRAEALAQRGEHEAAVALARAAVEIASATDALLDHADARVALAAALRAAGRRGEADAEERRAFELWEAKGATLLAEQAAREGASVVSAAFVPAVAAPPTRRQRVRPNAATENAARLDAAVAARDGDALLGLFADDMRILEHPTGASFDRSGGIASWRGLITARDPASHHEPLATLGESLALLRLRLSASGVRGRSMDVGAYEKDEIHLVEADGRGRRCGGEVWATTHLGDAVARLYERHAELLPAGPAQECAAGMARAVAGLSGPVVLERWAAAFAPDVEQVDHRTLGSWSAQGAAEALVHLRALLELTADADIRVDSVLAATSSAVLSRRTHVGTNAQSGGRYERVFLALQVGGADGRTVRLEFFDPDREAEALARLDALAARPGAPGTPLRRVRENKATRSFARGEAAFAARDAEALAQLFDASLVVVHHPSGAEYGRREMLGTWRGAMRATRFEFRQELLASLGETLALDRHVITVEGLTDAAVAGFGLSEFHEVSLLEVDAGGRWLRSEIFAADHLGDAIARLYARYAELLPAGPERARAEATAHSVGALLAPGQLEAWCATVAATCELDDHRTLGFPSLRGRDAVREFLRASLETSEGQAFRIDDLLGVRADAILWRGALVGTVRTSGGRFEIHHLCLTVIDREGLFERIEYFDPGREDDALERFEATSRRDSFENAAARADETLIRCFNTRDWPGVLACVAPRLVFDERRRMTRNTAEREIWLEQFRLMFDQPASRFTIRLLATRGERLSLHRHEFEAEVAGGGGPLEMEPHFALHEVDAEARIVAIVLFDLADEAAAYAELDTRFDAGEAAQGGPFGATQRMYEAVYRRDREACLAQLAPGFRVDDHRRLGWGATLVDAELFFRTQDLLVEMAPDFRYRVDHFALRGRAFLTRVAQVGTRDGGAFETPFLNTGALDDQSLLVGFDLYDVEELDAAFTHFGAISAAAPAEPFANAATRTAERMQGCWRAHDWEGYAGCLAPSLRYSDRRPLAQLELDRARYVEFIRQLGDMEQARLAFEPLATRGERLLLARLHAEVAGGDVGASDLELLCIYETDEHGAVVALVHFEGAALGAAYAELDARFAAGEGAAHPQASRLVAEFRRAFASRDWDAMDALQAPDQVAHDHRLVGWGTLRGAGAWTPTLQELVALSPDVRQRVDHLRTCERGLLWQFEWRGTHEGGAFETPLLAVFELDGEGRQQRLDVWEPGKLPAARARFAELAAPAAESPFANAATRAVERGAAAIGARDWDAFAALFTPSFRNFDRTAIGKLEVDREAWLAAFREQLEMTSGPLVPRVIATRGECLALVRMLWQGAGGDFGPSELDWLLIIEVDERGDHVAVVSFDPGDLDAAYAELDARFEAQEPAWMPGFCRAVARRDWDSMAGLCAPDMVAEDHRLVSWGTLRGLSEYLPSLRSMVELAPDVQLRLDHLRSAGRAELFETRWLGTRDGGAFEIPVVGVSELDERRRQRRLDLYDLEKLDQARARFEEIRASERSDPLALFAEPNAASAWLHRFQPAFNARDWDALPPFYAPDVTYEDRQRLSLLSGDIDMLWSSMRERAEAGARLERCQLLGTAGDRVAIQRLLWAGGGAEGRFEMEHIVVQEVDEAGRLVATINFDLDDTRAAQREAWARWFATEPAVAAVVEPLSRMLDAWNAQDRARLGTVFADDLVAEDHRHTGIGRLADADAYVESVVALWGLAPDSQLEAGWLWPALDRHGAITVVRRHGVLPEGSAFESEYLYLFTVARGLITRIEGFELEDVHAALARFEELRPDPLRIPPNASTRANDRWWALAEAEDWEAVRALTAGMVFEDRRRLIRIAGGAELLLADTRHLWDAGWRPARTLLATAGEQLSLERMLWTHAEDGQASEIEVLKVAEVDAEGRIVAYLIFDPDDRAAASEDLFERWVRQGADGVSPATIEFLRAWNAHDLGRMRALLPSDYVFHDHRRTGIGRVGGAEPYVASLAALWELSADVRLEMLYQVAQAQDAFLGVMRWFGTNAEGGEFEALFLSVLQIRGEQQIAVDLYEVEEMDAALARFEAIPASAARERP